MEFVHRRPSRYTPELRERAVKMVADVRNSSTSDHEAIKSVAGILGIEPKILGKWVRHSDRPSWKSLLFRTHAIVIGSIIIVIGGLGLAYSQRLFDIGQPGASISGSNLEVDQVSLSYGNWNGRIPDPFKIDIKLVNTGTQLAVINTARVVIQRSAALPRCGPGQEEFPATGFYQANLPADPPHGEVVDIPVSQLVPADGADRFDLLLRTQLPVTTQGYVYNAYLYRIHLYLTYNANNRALDLGEMIIGFPFAPPPGQYFWSKSVASNPAFFDTMMNNNKAVESRVRICDIKNSYTLRSMLSSFASGVKQPVDLAGISSQLAY